jgi:hypothetical protein
MNLIKHRHFFSDTADPVLFCITMDVSSPTAEFLQFLQSKQKNKHYEITEQHFHFDSYFVCHKIN